MELVRSFQTVSRDCLETPDGHQTGATQADTEGRGDRIFALQASDLASLTPLQPSFQTVSLETVWKIGMSSESGSLRPPGGAKRSQSAASWRQRSAVDKPSAIFQTVSRWRSRKFAWLRSAKT